MVSRIFDLRVAQALQHGVIVGLPPDEAEAIALVVDLLMPLRERRDLSLMFEGVRRHRLKGLKLRVTTRWWLVFEWMDGVGPVNMRLLE